MSWAPLPQGPMPRPLLSPAWVVPSRGAGTVSRPCPLAPEASAASAAETRASRGILPGGAWGSLGGWATLGVPEAVTDFATHFRCRCNWAVCAQAAATINAA